MKYVEMYDFNGQRITFEPEEFCELTDSCDLAHIKDFGFNHDVDFIVYTSTKRSDVIHLVKLNLYGAQYFIESREDRFYELLDEARGYEAPTSTAGA